MNLNLQGQTALIVGGASGIGLAIARAFAAEGAKIALIDRNPQTAALATGLGQEFSLPAAGAACDATDSTQAAAALKQITETLGPLEHFIYAAGAGSGKFGFPFWNLSPGDWSPVLATNLVGAVTFASLLGPQMAQRRRGTMAFISSVAGQIGSQTDPPYSAAKAALINFMQVAAKDLAPFGVRANAIAPGMVQTPLNQNVWRAWNEQQPPDQQRTYDDWAGEKVRKVIPLQRWQTPADVAAAVVFLASSQAANITGQTWNVDGGWVMHS